MIFRKDINGLRALAIIGVMIFHFQPELLPGGFSGVDVFFVISGYLMTGVIIRGFNADTFSTVGFYKARARRIFPALSILCISLCVIGALFFNPIEQKTLGKHIFSSLLFISNITYWRESGYFDVLSQSKWLLHTWSLSVEWQFYLLYPLILVVCKRIFSIQSIRYILLISVFILYVIGIFFTYKYPNASYYLLPTRSWEMLLGGVAYFFPFSLTTKNKKTVELIGMALILFSYFFLSAKTFWPGYMAMLPVLGAFLIIQSRREEKSIMKNVVFQNLGTWSYSIYLWHWPFVVAITYLNLSSYWIFLGYILSILFGRISFYYVEKKNVNLTFIFILPVFLGLLSYYSNGLTFLYGQSKSDRLNVAINGEEDIELNRANCMKGIKSSCVYGSSPAVISLVGDSHASATITAVSEGVKNHGGVNLYSMGSCPTLSGISNTDCSEFNQFIINKLKLIKLPVILVNSTYPVLENDFFIEVPSFSNKEKNSLFYDVYVKTICDIASSNKVYLLRPYPIMEGKVPELLVEKILNNNFEDVFVMKDKYLQATDTIRSAQDKAVLACNVTVLDPSEYLCDDKKCYGSRNGIPLYSDSNHLSEFGNKLLIPMFEKNVSF